MEKFDTSRLDGHTLRVFLMVCETGSVSRAAEHFELNQSTISHTIDKMRTALGDPLFVKSGRGIAPTERALSLVPRVQEIVAGLEGLFQSEDYDATTDTKPISVALPTPALMPQMKAVHLALRQAAPEVLFRVERLAPRERLAEMLIQDQADVAIAINAPGYPVILNSTSYGTDRLVVYYDPTCRDAVHDVAAYQAAIHGVAGFGGQTKSVVDQALEELGMRRKIGFVAPTASSLGEFLSGSEMIATMPLGLASGAYSGLAYCEPPLPLPAIKYDLVWHRRFDHSGRHCWIRQVLLDHAPPD